jgi:type I restriction enzyme R subunit
MIHFTQGDILCDDSEAVVNPVNCVGVMGRGLALQFRKAYPDVFRLYAEACKRGEVQPGRMFVTETGALLPRYVVNSRLNRAHPEKRDVFVLDFQNNSETVTQAFSDYYRTTILSEETDPNTLHDLKLALDAAQVYSQDQIDGIVELFLAGASREKLDPILDVCVAAYLEQLDEDGQVDFKSKAKIFTRAYDFLGSILPYGNREWEKLSILLNLLIPKLPAPKEEDLSKGILESIDMDSYRVEKKQAIQIAAADDDAEIDPMPVEGGGRKTEPDLDRLSNILKAFNEQFGTLFTDADRIFTRIKDEIAPLVAADQAFRNARVNTPGAARIEHDKALAKVMLTLLKDDTQVYKQFVENEAFRRAVSDFVYSLTAA